MTDKSAMTLYAKPQHKAAARALGYVLTLGDTDAWFGLVPILARLDRKEQVALAYMALRACDPDDAGDLVDTLMTSHGAPSPPLLGFMDEAAFWADLAEPEELEAYVIACFNRMHPARRAAFLAFAEKRAA